jgi:hypothetical protein
VKHEPKSGLREFESWVQKSGQKVIQLKSGVHLEI